MKIKKLSIFILLPLFSLLLSASLIGCTSLFLQPSREHFPFVEKDGLTFDSNFITSKDGTAINVWYFSSDKNSSSCHNSKGLVLQAHGNAENMSTHYRLLSWLLNNCYDLMTFDYRGYGQSEGSRSIAGSIEDSRAAIAEAHKKAQAANIPLIIYGQSLGGSLVLRTLSEFKDLPKPNALIIEGSFYSYQQISREKLALSPLTWLLQPIVYLLISDRYQPGGKQLKNLQNLPTLIIHSRGDPVVPYNHGQQIFKDLNEPKWFWTIEEPGHLNGMFTRGGQYRKELLEWLDFTLNKNSNALKK